MSRDQQKKEKIKEAKAYISMLAKRELTEEEEKNISLFFHDYRVISEDNKIENQRKNIIELNAKLASLKK